MLKFSLFLECDNREQVHSVQQAAILILEHSLPWPDRSNSGKYRYSADLNCMVKSTTDVG